MLSDYAVAGDQLLQEIVTQLEADNRVVAAWLAGSLGRGEGDAISDLDVTVVLTDEAAQVLCDRPWQVGGRITPERLELFSRFGRPALIHENHHNAPPGGTLTFILYEETALIVDWILRPQSQAQWPERSRLLFDRVGIPPQLPAEPLEPAERARIASEKVAFFWMMAAVVVKYIVQEDTLLFNSWLDELHWLVYDVEGLLAGKTPVFEPRARLPLALTVEAQQEALRQAGRRMVALAPAVVELGGYVPADPMTAVEKRLAFA
ncbi:MAG: hypothetical protein L0332_16520 [Chloroflexi bacterium]|nr:hypothetical protein [Chloroflexota bacterium]MCI0579108.1 hypothetical protein [Chloroflexota bacterium]MCI0643325.1 hypothetical protein [Chloroflexota bacterium]MCI0728304.1 hypothetical protein [Chloroflexota bacterium]